MTTVLFQNQEIWLSDKEFFYQGHTYALTKIKKAFAKKRFLKSTKLIVEFKNGKTQDFQITPDDQSAYHWAETINQLLRK